MFKLFRYLGKREWAMAGCALLFILGQVWLDLRLPEYMSEITVLVQTEGSAMGDILHAGGLMLLCALGSMVLAIATGFLTAVVSASLTRNLQSALYHKVLSFGSEEMGRFSTASLITRTTNDVTQVQMVLSMGLQMLVKAPVTAVLAILKIQEKGSPQWTLLTAAAVILLLVVLGLQMVYVLPKFKKVQKLTDNLNRIMRENLTGLRVVRAYNAENYQEGKFTGANDALTDNNLKAGRATSLMGPFMSLVMNGVSLGIYWIGAYIIEAAGMGVKLTIFSNMVVFSSYAMQVISSFMMLTVIFIMLPRAQVAAQRIREVLDTVVPAGGSEYDRELAIHDWMVEWASYDSNTLSLLPDFREDPDNGNPYGLLVNGRGICSGYTSTFQLFMDLLGIECITVEGTAYGGSEAHAWNQVRLDGEWYCVDVTWDDPVASFPVPDWMAHSYFNVTGDYMRRTDHQWDESAVPEATGTAYAWRR